MRGRFHYPPYTLQIFDADISHSVTPWLDHGAQVIIKANIIFTWFLWSESPTKTLFLQAPLAPQSDG